MLRTPEAINWTAAVFGAADWLPVGVISVAMLLLGLALLRTFRTSRLRTAAAAVAAAPATGGLIALEIFVVWTVSQLV